MAANESAPRAHEGTGVTPLSGVGTAVWYDPNAELELGEPPAAETVDPDAERERFEDARDRARAELERERERTAERVGEDEAAVFDAHKQFVDDPQIIDGVEAAVDDGLPAEHGIGLDDARDGENTAGCACHAAGGSLLLTGLQKPMWDVEVGSSSPSPSLSSIPPSPTNVNSSSVSTILPSFRTEMSTDGSVVSTASPLSQ